MPVKEKMSAHEIKRMQTRERLMGAAIAEFKRSGMAAAEIGTIVAAAGVAHGTFYFHFPTKEHVLLELERREEARIANELRRALASSSPSLRSALTEAVRLVLGLEKRLGTPLYKDLLALNFSQTRPPADAPGEHPMITLIIGEIERAREAGEADHDVDAFRGAVIFLHCLYALLTPTYDWTPRETTRILDTFVSSSLRGMGAR
jgi:AcrR family transcriptional regulator